MFFFFLLPTFKWSSSSVPLSACCLLFPVNPTCNLGAGGAGLWISQGRRLKEALTLRAVRGWACTSNPRGSPSQSPAPSAPHPPPRMGVVYAGPRVWSRENWVPRDWAIKHTPVNKAKSGHQPNSLGHRDLKSSWWLEVPKRTGWSGDRKRRWHRFKKCPPLSSENSLAESGWEN